MKKLFGISLVALLAVSPMMASAEGLVVNVNKDPASADTANMTEQQIAAITGGALKYEAKAANTTNDVKPATAGYVKGAYNAAIKGVNAIQGEYETLKDRYDHAFDDYAINDNDQVINTIQDATVVDEEVKNSSLGIHGFSGLTGNNFNADVTVSVSIPSVMGDWDTDATLKDGQGNDIPVATSTTVQSAAINLASATLSAEGVTANGNINGAAVTSANIAAVYTEQ